MIKMAPWLCKAVALGFVATAGLCAHARGESYPTKLITIIVPAAPGGVTDMLGRVLAQRFIADWGAQAVVENKPGANNQVAAEYVARQPADGYTLLVGPESTFIVNPTLYGHLSYDLAKDFTPISGLVIVNHVLVVNPTVPSSLRSARQGLASSIAAPMESLERPSQHGNVQGDDRRQLRRGALQGGDVRAGTFK